MIKLFSQSHRRILGANASTFFIHGPPGSGKSYLLRQLHPQFASSKHINECLGPYTVDWQNLNKLAIDIDRDCIELGLSNSEYPHASTPNELFEWLMKEERMRAETLVILIDLANSDTADISVVGTLFTAARNIETFWENGHTRLHIIFAGFWNIFDLVSHYQKQNTSFPYTVGDNFSFYHGLSEENLVSYISEVRPDANNLNGKILYELTDGHPSICNEVLKLIPKGNLSINAILHAVSDAAANGEYGDKLIEICKRLPDSAVRFLSNLLMKRHLRSEVLSELRSQLIGSGIVKEALHGSIEFLTFRSWYIELLLRYRGKEVGIELPQNHTLDPTEMMPDTKAINRIAYEVIFDIENQIRNFVVIQTSLLHAESHVDFLDYEIPYRDHEKNVRTVSNEYRQKAIRNNMTSVSMNPSMAFLMTSHLRGTVEYLAKELNSTAWCNIAESLRNIEYIRNSVMHNQLINETELQKLIDLQNDIYETLEQA